MTQLPSNVFAVDLWRHAYARCLDFESSSISALPPTQGPSPLVCARFLGYMIREAPADTGRDNISNDLIDCTDNEALKSLATLYIDVFLRCCEHSLHEPSSFILDRSNLKLSRPKGTLRCPRILQNPPVRMTRRR